MNTKKKSVCGAVLVVGAGISGIQASLDLSAAGFRVYLIEQGPTVGGRMARLDKTFPTGDCATCIVSPKLVECMRDLNIDVHTLTTIQTLEGKAGNFTATLIQQPRYVDMSKCTGCGDCAEVCPVTIPSAFDEGLGKRKAIDRVYAQAVPNVALIKKKFRAPCSTGCPIDSSVQAYVTLIAQGKFEESAAVIHRENPLPSICGRVCFHPCQLHCNRGRIDQAINIRALKRFVIDKFPHPDLAVETAPMGKSVAVIGSGPAGLAVARSCALKGHKVEVFEALPVLGGMLAVGIPAYRLPPEILQRDIENIRSLGVTFTANAEIADESAAEKLRNEFDALFIATGAHKSRILDIPNEECEGVMHGVDFLRSHSLNQPLSIGTYVTVVGGGNSAIDAARTAKRLGAQHVTILYRRSRNEMPASDEEIHATLEEGITIEYLTAPSEILCKDNKITGLRCIQMRLGRPDESGRRRPLPIEGSEFTLATDMLIPAISQSPEQKLAQLFDLERTRWGTLKTDPFTMATSQEGIFAGGDVVLGPSSVIEAIGQGLRAALSIDNFLNNKALAEGIPHNEARSNPLSREKLFEKKNRIEPQESVPVPHVKDKARTADFREVELCYTDLDAQKEAMRCLNCADCSECKLCEQACKAGAILHDDVEKTFDVTIGAVLLTPGLSAFDPIKKLEYGTGYLSNIVTNVQFERILSASGPTGGQITRPSDGVHPTRLAFIQCVGSRDARTATEYCSSVCCMAATKEAILAKEHEPGLAVTIFYMDLRAYGKDFDRYYERAQRMGIEYIRCRPSYINQIPITENLLIGYMGDNNDFIEKEFDMVVLSCGLVPSESLKEQAQGIGIALNSWGFAETDELRPLETSVPGIFVGGAFQEPKDIPDAVIQASGSASKVMSLLAPARGTLVRKKTYPPERDITDEPPRVGVFVCHCGSNIASVVDVEKVVEYARGLPYVVFAEHAVYVCADDSQDMIKQRIEEYKINRVVIASCTPRTHEPIFRDTLRDAGLNQYLLEMANIRDQCSWVHAHDPDSATMKAKDLVRMIAGRAAKLVPLKDETQPVNNAALVIGGGIAGMTAALALSEQGFPVHLVEKEGRLGGTLWDMYKTLGGHDIRDFLKQTIEKVNNDPRITVYLNTQASKVDGHIGEFSTTLVSTGGSMNKRSTNDEDTNENTKGTTLDHNTHTTTVEHGAVIIATGATEQKPTTYGYGKDPYVITQLELADHLRNESLPLSPTGTVVMIQCVEQRNEERPYCSRVCCSTSVKTALFIKERFPRATVIVLYRDMRTYGFRENAYQEARAKGILFIRYDIDNPPVVTTHNGMSVQVYEKVLGNVLEIHPDLLVLASPIVPRADRQQLSELLRIPLNEDGFFLEAHVKLRPVDFASEGLFLCGTAHAPKFINETISQAHAVASRAAAILSSTELPVSGQTAWVDQDSCISCMTCVHICPYNAPRINENNKAEIQAAVCMGCGSCTSDCPAKAISLRHYTDNQILNALDALLLKASKEKTIEPQYPEYEGITPPRWHKG